VPERLQEVASIGQMEVEGCQTIAGEGIEGYGC
jgi:hypothetical protein